jgi:mannan endo-1,4-beta-mannosidase
VPPPLQGRSALPWIRVAKYGRYFETEAGDAWTPIGQNDAITWPDLEGCYRRRDMRSAEAYLEMLAAHGVTVLRLMLEYAQDDAHYFEHRAGEFQPDMVALWDDLFGLCARHGLRILLTPFDTFWMRVRDGKHPYLRANGGPCPDGSSLLCCPETRKLIKARLAFATGRWGAGGTLFAWDLWNEIHPLQAGGTAECFTEFITDISTFLRSREIELHGRAHPQTVSFFLPDIHLDERIPEAIYRHPCLDFASPHFYAEGSIDFPRNTVEPAVAVGRLMRRSLGELCDSRPVLDSEHGPIHGFNDLHITLPEKFDDEYFRHMQWAHLASGGAGGGMRWPYRHPHSLTGGMRAAQRELADFVPLIDWGSFQPENLNEEVDVPDAPFHVFACGDSRQAIVWLLRGDTFATDGRIGTGAPALCARICVPGLEAGRYRVTLWHTGRGRAAHFEIEHGGNGYAEIQLTGVIDEAAVAIAPVTPRLAAPAPRLP